MLLPRPGADLVDDSSDYDPAHAGSAAPESIDPSAVFFMANLALAGDASYSPKSRMVVAPDMRSSQATAVAARAAKGAASFGDNFGMSIKAAQAGIKLFSVDIRFVKPVQFHYAAGIFAIDGICPTPKFQSKFFEQAREMLYAEGDTGTLMRAARRELHLATSWRTQRATPATMPSSSYAKADSYSTDSPPPSASCPRTPANCYQQSSLRECSGPNGAIK